MSRQRKTQTSQLKIRQGLPWSFSRRGPQKKGKIGKISRRKGHSRKISTVSGHQYADNSPEHYSYVLENFDGSELTQRIYSCYPRHHLWPPVVKAFEITSTHGFLHTFPTLVLTILICKANGHRGPH